jgi:wobble nucleotide-excising tRNase
VFILQGQTNQIVSEASELFQGSQAKMDSLSKRITDNTVLITVLQNSIKKVNDNISSLTKRIDNVNIIMTAISKSLKEDPSKKDLRDHTAAMDDQIEAV